VPEPTTSAGKALAQRARDILPPAALPNALHGLERLAGYQDVGYAALYLDRLEVIARLDAAPHALTSETARHLALWMSYEDTIRVADLKTRDSRLQRVRSEVKVSDGQLLAVTEFMHPRLQEVCETLPASIGRSILQSKRLRGMLEPFFEKGRHVETTSLKWFLMLRLLAGMRRFRPRSLRYVEEQERIEKWLARVREAAVANTNVALEIVKCQRLIKGYGDTFERGLGNFERLMAALETRPHTPEQISALRDLALADEKGVEFKTALEAA
jgi:indolepyruvate ferredoxin oxidoreductase beta subunit